MPRISPEARSSSLYLASTKPLSMPKGLEPAAARAVWQKTIGSRPLDFFHRSDGELLTRFCTLSARAQELEQLIAVTPPDNPEAAGIERRLVAISAALGTLASKLRIVPQARIERHSGQRMEVSTLDDPLIAVFGGRKGRNGGAGHARDS
jgi:hypothetical protein